MGSGPLSLARLLLALVLISLPLLWLLLHRLGNFPGGASRRLHHGHANGDIVESYDDVAAGRPNASPPPGTTRPARTHTLILTTFRSGSSFLGQIFNHHPDVFYLPEPAWHVWDARPLGTAAGMLERQAEVASLLGSLLQCRAAALAPYLKLPVNRPQPLPRQQRRRHGDAVDGDKGEDGEQAMRSAMLSQLFQFSESRALCAPPACNASARPTGRGTRRTGTASATAGGERGAPQGSDCLRACGGERLERGVRESCLARHHAVIKETRLMELAALRALLEEPALRLRVVHLVRDPRAVHLSRGRAFHDLGDDLSTLKIICDANHNISRSMRGLGDIFAAGAGGGGYAGDGGGSSDRGGDGGADPGGGGGGYNDVGGGSLDDVASTLLRDRYALVRYEDLVQEPVVALRRLFSFAGISADPQLLSLALNMTRGAAADGPAFSVRPRDALRVASKWRQEMSFESVSRVQEACSSMMTSYGYRAMASERETRELKVPSTSPLGEGRG
ncbi:carbohydrate sulfotransferase 6-like [Petromyzon marinus]|uniref:Sulfotransferase n=1 Tax=Petromyzon marinus TaxID=7757 RepID=A0AAJ7SSP6_PETMA|nr:carbohydrate sulfotransferase 4-like [Petromyzon marinus]